MRLDLTTGSTTIIDLRISRKPTIQQMSSRTHNRWGWMRWQPRFISLHVIISMVSDCGHGKCQKPACFSLGSITISNCIQTLSKILARIEVVTHTKLNSANMHQLRRRDSIPLLKSYNVAELSLRSIGWF